MAPISSTPAGRILLCAGLLTLATGGTAALFALTGKSPVAVGFGMLVAPMLVSATPIAVASTARLSAALGVTGVVAIGATVWRLNPRDDGDYVLPAVVIVVAALEIGLLAARVRGRWATIVGAIAAATLSVPAWIGVFALLRRLRPVRAIPGLPLENEWGVVLAAYAVVLVELAAIGAGVAAVRLPLLGPVTREPPAEGADDAPGPPGQPSRAGVRSGPPPPGR